jgi:restriction system protein
MAIPDYQSILLPLLSSLADGQQHRLQDLYVELADYFKLTPDERRELLPSGQQAIWHNRVGWARTYLKKAGLLAAPERATFLITDRGRDVLAQQPASIDLQFLEQFEEFRQFKSKSKPRSSSTQNESEVNTPEENLEQAYQNLRDTLAQDILQQLKVSPPALFEKTVVELLVKMGYGGSLKDAGKAIGRSGDEGIDGIIKEDRLGLDIIYIQAKRWENTVGRPEIQKFAGALQGQRARKGIFITTASFSKDAVEYAARIETKIVLIDGDQLTQYMIDHNVGVTPMSHYEIKRLDLEYFSDS